jgi:hypothetical protein
MEPAVKARPRGATGSLTTATTRPVGAMRKSRRSDESPRTQIDPAPVVIAQRH